MQPGDLKNDMLRFVRTRRLVREHDRVLIAVSGGIDSVVLLHLFRSVQAALNVELYAAHFDHAMRPDSAGDADWVRGLCHAWEIPLASGLARRPLFGETDARNERYRFLLEAARASGATRIATAHHADDQVETVLFRILRGTGLRGLAGIPIRRGRIIRPLLRSTKQDITHYALAHHLSYRTDVTNEQLAYVRNRIRSTVLPAIETVTPQARSAVRALARYAARTEAAWRSALRRVEADAVLSSGADLIELARPVLLGYHPELRARLLRQLLRRHGFVPGRAETASIVAFCQRAESGAALDVGRTLRIERAFDAIRITSRAVPAALPASVALVGADGTATLHLGGRRYDVAWSVSDFRREGAEHFSVSSSDVQLELRAWQPGDRIRLAYGTKKLKKLFVERRVPAFERTRIPVLADAAGRVLWVVGVARSIDAVPAPTGPALNIMVKDAEHS